MGARAEPGGPRFVAPASGGRRVPTPPTVSRSVAAAAPWPKVRLGEIGRIAMCKRILKGETTPQGDIPFFKIGTFGKEADAFISKSKFEHFSKLYSYPKKGSVLISAAGTIGRLVVFNGLPAYFQDSNIVWLEHDGQRLCDKYLYYTLLGHKWQFTQGATIQRLYNDDIRNTTISLPPLPVQRAIAGRLSAYDDLIENNKKRIAILERMAEQLYKEWFVRRRLSRHATAPSAALSLGDIIEVSRGLSYTSSEIDTDAGVQLINLKNIQPYGGFRYDGSKRFDGKYKPDQIVVRGDLVMGVTDMTQDRRAVGSVALMPPLKETSVISADLIKIEPKIDKHFLYAMFRYGGLSRYISQFANGANVLHLRPQSIMGIKVQVPSEEAMERLSARLRPMIALMDNLNEQNALLSRQRDLLLPRLMSGKLEVKS